MSGVPKLSRRFLLTGSSAFVTHSTAPKSFFAPGKFPVIELEGEEGGGGGTRAVCVGALFETRALVTRSFRHACECVPRRGVSTCELDSFGGYGRGCSYLMGRAVKQRFQRSSSLRHTVILCCTLTIKRNRVGLVKQCGERVPVISGVGKALRNECGCSTQDVDVESASPRRVVGGCGPVLFYLGSSRQTSRRSQLHTETFLREVFPRGSRFRV